MNSSNLLLQIDNIIDNLQNDVDNRNKLIDSIEEDTKDLEELKNQKLVFEEAHRAVVLYLERGKEKTKKIFEEINTTAISSIFGEGHEVELIYEQNRGKSSANIVVNVPLPNGNVISTYIDNNGGGFLDTISMTFYLCQLELLHPRPSGPLIADEPFKHLDSKKSRKCADVLRSILNPDGLGADGTGRQFILSTHSDIFKNMADRIFEFVKIENELLTKVEDITDSFTERETS